MKRRNNLMIRTKENKNIFTSMLQVTEDSFSQKLTEAINKNKITTVVYDFKKEKIVTESEASLFYQYKIILRKYFFGDDKELFTKENLVNLCKQKYLELIENYLSDDEYQFNLLNTDMKELLSETDFIKLFNEKYHYGLNDQIVHQYIYENNQYFQNHMNAFGGNVKLPAALTFCLYHDMTKFLNLLRENGSDTDTIEKKIISVDIVSHLISFSKEEKLEIASILKEKMYNESVVQSDLYDQYIQLMKSLTNDENFENNDVQSKNRFHRYQLFLNINANSIHHYQLDLKKILSQQEILDSNEECIDYYFNELKDNDADRFLYSSFVQDLTNLIELVEDNQNQFSILDENIIDDFHETILGTIDNMVENTFDDISMQKINHLIQRFNQSITKIKQENVILDDKILIVYDQQQIDNVIEFNPYYYETPYY